MALQFRTAKRWVTKRVTPDYTNQLDLFSDASPETADAIGNAPVRTSGLAHGRPRPPKQLDFGAWEPLPPEDGRSTPLTRPAPANTGGEERTAYQPPVQPEIGAEG